MFVFNGKNSKDFNIVVEEIDNLIKKAAHIHEIVSIEGKDDAEYIPLSYAPVDLTLKLQLLDPNKIDDVFQWLNGIGELEFKDRVTKARIFAELAPVRASIIKIIDVDIIRSPFWYKKHDYYVEATTKIINGGNVYSKPLIKLTKQNSDFIEIKVGGSQFKYNFNNEAYSIIDCDEKIATHNNLSRNRQLEIGYEFPILQPGINEVSILAGDATVEFKRKDVWL